MGAAPREAEIPVPLSSPPRAVQVGRWHGPGGHLSPPAFRLPAWRGTSGVGGGLTAKGSQTFKASVIAGAAASTEAGERLPWAAQLPSWQADAHQGGVGPPDLKGQSWRGRGGRSGMCASGL